MHAISAKHRFQFRISTLLWLALVVSLTLLVVIQRRENAKLQIELSGQINDLALKEEQFTKLAVQFLEYRMDKEAAETTNAADPVQALIERMQAEDRIRRSIKQR